MKALRVMLLILAIIVLILISYLFVDRPVVWFLVEHHSRQFGLLRLFANDITFTLTILIFFFYIYYAVRLSKRGIGRFDRELLLCCNAVVIGQFLKDILKSIFGRYWTATFVCNNPSLVSNHVYGFNWFRSGSSYASFPSGHATFIFSFSVSMWYLFPKLRWLWSLLAFLVILGQIGMYYHFVSDVVAGGLLGSLVGFYSTYRFKHARIEV